jgi:hypothetical protein
MLPHSPSDYGPNLLKPVARNGYALISSFRQMLGRMAYADTNVVADMTSCTQDRQPEGSKQSWGHIGR